MHCERKNRASMIDIMISCKCHKMLVSDQSHQEPTMSQWIDRLLNF